ncbi:hypothetical protein GN244_ATG11266 [Phytophthora infestans]|uniref:Uncharacterized protein n=1 Tax=Phytophthora infestans TaxID=4787 RepID=A0A833WBM2_PHYIN|nr:hypothetical protein GN244_ATG11266 [Phytophthora infestans]
METCLIPQHKPTHLYGSTIVFIPQHFLKEVDNFKLLRQELLKEFFFIATDGHPERYLTRILEEHVHDKFSKHVTMRNCRSINITYEAHHAKSVKEMYELSRLMYHSFG